MFDSNLDSRLINLHISLLLSSQTFFLFDVINSLSFSVYNIDNSLLLLLLWFYAFFYDSNYSIFIAKKKILQFLLSSKKQFDKNTSLKILRPIPPFWKTVFYFWYSDSILCFLKVSRKNSFFHAFAENFSGTSRQITGITPIQNRIRLRPRNHSVFFCWGNGAFADKIIRFSYVFYPYKFWTILNYTLL